MADYSYIGSGKMSLREVGAAAGFLFAGNVSALSFNVTEDTKELKDFTQPGGGTYNEVRRVSAVEMTFTAHDISPDNLARALYGSASAVASAAVTNENLTVYPGAYTPFEAMHDATVAPTIVPAQAAASSRANTTAYALGAYIRPATPNGFYYKATAAGTSGGTLPTFPTTVGATVTDGTVTWTCAGKTALVAGTDYDLGTAGIDVAAAATIAGEVWVAGYTKAAHSVVQALVASGKEYEVLFEGLNEARSGKRTRVRAWRVKAGVLASLALIGEEYAAMEQTGKLLKDTTKTGAGVSQYFRVEIEA